MPQRGVSPLCAWAIPFEIAPLQPSHIVRPEAVPPEHPCAAALPSPILRRLCSPSQRAAAPRSAWLRAARGGRWGGRCREGSAKRPFEFP